MKTRLRGTVTSDKNSKTIKVVVERRSQHPKYGKIVRGRTVCHCHDEREEAKLGDFVEIVESRPHSRLKRWELASVVRASDAVAVQASLEEAAEVPEAFSATAADGESGGAAPAADATTVDDSVSENEPNA